LLHAKELESGKGNRIAMVAGVAALVLVLVVVVICSRRNNGKWWSRPIADSDKGGSVVGIATFKYADLQDATKRVASAVCSRGA
jgi:hypothetical protein